MTSLITDILRNNGALSLIAFRKSLKEKHDEWKEGEKEKIHNSFRNNKLDEVVKRLKRLKRKQNSPRMMIPKSIDQNRTVFSPFEETPPLGNFVTDLYQSLEHKLTNSGVGQEGLHTNDSNNARAIVTMTDKAMMKAKHMEHIFFILCLDLLSQRNCN